MYEKRIMELVIQVEDEHERYVGLEDDMISLKKASSDHHSSLQVSFHFLDTINISNFN